MDSYKLFILHLCEGPWQAEWYSLCMLLSIGGAMVLSYYAAKGFLWCVGRIVQWTDTDWDDDLLNPRLLRAVAKIAPAIVLDRLLPLCFLRPSVWIARLQTGASIYILCAAAIMVCIFITNLYHALARRKHTSFYAVKGVFDMFRFIVAGAAVIIGVSILWGRSPGAILTALGASAAVLMLVFKDTILGLVAGVQLTVNHMLRAGDWIAAEKHGINGEVIEVSLATVKVRNWDNSVSTVPPYVLMTESFRNFQPMKRSGARRVERSVYIDVHTVRFLDPDELDRLQAKGWLEGLDIGEALRTVNLSLLRRYLQSWLEGNGNVCHSMITMVRQLQPTQAGLPLQLYFFINNTEWRAYEEAQSDIFDHVYAVVNEFGLRIYQAPGSEITVRNV